VNKIILLLFIGSFFLDFSFISVLFGSSLSWPYFTLSLLISIFLLNKNKQKNIVWIVLGVFLLNILLPLNIFAYILIIITVWSVIYIFENIFFNEEHNYFKNNFIFSVNFVLFGILVFGGQCIKAKMSGECSFSWQDINWTVFALKLIMGSFIYNLTYRVVYRICGKNTQALR